MLLAFHFLQEKDVRKWKEELLEQRRRMMEEKLLHAEFKRELQLQAIVKKAQEEEAKVLRANLLQSYILYIYIYFHIVIQGCVFAGE